MEILELGIDEIMQMILIAALLLSIGLAIAYVADPDKLMAKATAHEVSYISTLVTNNNIVVEINYEDIKIQENNNKITAEYDNKPFTKDYLGKNVKIEQTGENSFKISS